MEWVIKCQVFLEKRAYKIELIYALFHNLLREGEEVDAVEGQS
jgi:hypothetical protein